MLSTSSKSIRTKSKLFLEDDDDKSWTAARPSVSLRQAKIHMVLESSPRRRAISLPIPLLAPVTIATLSHDDDDDESANATGAATTSTAIGTKTKRDFILANVGMLVITSYCSSY